jgi:hypothetical protein
MSLLYDSHGDPQIFPARPTVTHYRPVGNGTLTFLNVLFPGGLTICEIRLFNKDGRRWVTPPTHAFERRNGETQYRWLLDFSTPEQQDEFQAEVLAAVDRFIGGKTGNEA